MPLPPRCSHGDHLARVPAERYLSTLAKVPLITGRHRALTTYAVLATQVVELVMIKTVVSICDGSLRGFIPKYKGPYASYPEHNRANSCPTWRGSQLRGTCRPWLRSVFRVSGFERAHNLRCAGNSTGGDCDDHARRSNLRWFTDRIPSGR